MIPGRLSRPVGARLFHVNSKSSLCVLTILMTAPLLLAACDNVQFVEHVVLVNETDYPANIDVKGDRGGWLGLTMVSADETREVREVIHQGSSWTFRFRYATFEPVELTLTEEELIDADWSVEVPVEFEENLRAEGVVPPP